MMGAPDGARGREEGGGTHKAAFPSPGKAPVPILDPHPLRAGRVIAPRQPLEIRIVNLGPLGRGVGDVARGRTCS